MTLQEEEASTGLSEQEGTEGPRPPPDFGRSVNPITSSGGTDYAHQNITLRFLLYVVVLSYILFVYTIRSQQLCFYIKIENMYVEKIVLKFTRTMRS